jgi:hypothetical protein
VTFAIAWRKKIEGGELLRFGKFHLRARGDILLFLTVRCQFLMRGVFKPSSKKRPYLSFLTQLVALHQIFIPFCVCQIMKVSYKKPDSHKNKHQVKDN